MIKVFALFWMMIMMILVGNESPHHITIRPLPKVVSGYIDPHDINVSSHDKSCLQQVAQNTEILFLKNERYACYERVAIEAMNRLETIHFEFDQGYFHGYLMIKNCAALRNIEGLRSFRGHLWIHNCPQLNYFPLDLDFEGVLHISGNPYFPEEGLSESMRKDGRCFIDPRDQQGKVVVQRDDALNIVAVRDESGNFVPIQYDFGGHKADIIQQDPPLRPANTIPGF